MFMLKICLKNIGVHHSLEKNETATMFFLKNFSSYNVFMVFSLSLNIKIT